VAGEAGGPGVAAVIDLFGCLPDELGRNAARLPPTLVLHGGADKVVKVEKALALEGLLERHGRAFEIKIYDKQEHLFGAQMLSLDALDAQRRALEPSRLWRACWGATTCRPGSPRRRPWAGWGRRRGARPRRW
jgi:acetyl esterase/lipase